MEKQSKPKATSSIFLRNFIMVAFAILVIILVTGMYLRQNSARREIGGKEITGPNVERVIGSGRIIIGTDATFAPMEFVDSKGNFIGYDIDLGNKISEELNIKAEFKNITWEKIFQALKNKEVDVVISGVTITDERQKEFDFSDPYLNAGQVIITKKDNNSIKSTKDLRGKRIAVQRGTTNEQEASKYTAIEMVMPYDDFIGATKALLSGKADVIFSDLTGAKGIVDANPSLKIASDPFTSEFYGIVFRKGETDLVHKINSVIDLLRQRGVLVFLKQKWLE